VTLIEAIAKGHRWQAQLESGEYASLEDLAKDVVCDRTYVGRMLRLTSLDDTAPVAAEAREATKDATDVPDRDTGERGAMGAKREAKPISLLDAAAHLLSLGTGDPIRCKDIVGSKGGSKGDRLLSC
jgi:hypothetical protein